MNSNAECGVRSAESQQEADPNEESYMKFRIYRNGARFVTERLKGDWRWQLVTLNGHIIALSWDSYKTKAGCLNGIRALRTGALNATVEEIRSAECGMLNHE